MKMIMAESASVWLVVDRPPNKPQRELGRAVNLECNAKINNRIIGI
jgi:hypothetical protein